MFARLEAMRKYSGVRESPSAVNTPVQICTKTKTSARRYRHSNRAGNPQTQFSGVPSRRISGSQNRKPPAVSSAESARMAITEVDTAGFHAGRLLRAEQLADDDRAARVAAQRHGHEDHCDGKRRAHGSQRIFAHKPAATTLSATLYSCWNTALSSMGMVNRHRMAAGLPWDISVIKATLPLFFPPAHGRRFLAIPHGTCYDTSIKQIEKFSIFPQKSIVKDVQDAEKRRTKKLKLLYLADLLRRDISFDVILGGNDPRTGGLLAALQQARREEGVLIYGIDGSPDFKAILDVGYVTGTSAQSPRSIGRKAAETAYRYLDGEPVEKYISLPSTMITRDNLHEFEIDGWQ